MEAETMFQTSPKGLIIQFPSESMFLEIQELNSQFNHFSKNIYTQ